MANLNNPAGRLHAVLERYEAVRGPNPGRSLEDTWADALGLQGVGLRVALARTAALVPKIAEAAASFEADHGDSSSREMVETHASEWLKPVILAPVANGGAVNTAASVVDPSAMVALHSFSFTLSRLRPEGNDISSETRQALTEEISDVLASVRAADLPDGLKRLIVECLHAITDALDHYQFTGTGGVESAYDRLVAALARTFRDHSSESWWKKASDAVKNGYAAVGVAVTLWEGGQLAINTVDTVRQLTNGG